MATKNSIGSNIPIELEFGGLQQTTHTANGPLKGNGSSAVSNFGTGTDGQILIGSSIGAPIWANITPGSNFTITNSSHGIDMKTNPAGGGGSISGPTSWTPVLNFTTSSAGITYTTQTGYYMNLNKCIVFSFVIILSSKGSASGNAYVTGLPGTIVGPDNNPTNCVTYNMNAVGPLGSAYTIQGTIINATNQINIVKWNLATASTQLVATEFTNTSEIYGNGIYFIS